MLMKQFNICRGNDESNMLPIPIIQRFAFPKCMIVIDFNKIKELEPRRKYQI